MTCDGTLLGLEKDTRRQIPVLLRLGGGHNPRASPSSAETAIAVFAPAAAVNFLRQYRTNAGGSSVELGTKSVHVG